MSRPVYLVDGARTPFLKARGGSGLGRGERSIDTGRISSSGADAHPQGDAEFARQDDPRDRPCRNGFDVTRQRPAMASSGWPD